MTIVLIAIYVIVGVIVWRRTFAQFWDKRRKKPCPCQDAAHYASCKREDHPTRRVPLAQGAVLALIWPALLIGGTVVGILYAVLLGFRYSVGAPTKAERLEKAQAHADKMRKESEKVLDECREALTKEDKQWLGL